MKITQIICEEYKVVSPREWEQLADLQSSFHQDHLAWICEYCRVAANHSRSHFYTALFKLSAAFLKEMANLEPST